MARPESIAVGGFFPTPQHLIPLIARHLEVGTGHGSISYADPCAGDGAAIVGLSQAMGSFGEVYSCEMEAQRHAGLVARLEKDWHSKSRALHGDAFRLELSPGVGVLLLNPPYDTDPVHGRLEQRFLDRFTTALAEGGVVIFVVPFYALEASAETFARQYDDVACFRFPKDDFAAFKQVVVFASKVSTRLAPDSEILAKVRGWAKSVTRCPVLGSKTDTHQLIPFYSTPTWRLRDIDLKGLIAKARPWKESRVKGAGALTAVPHILPAIPVEDLLFRTYQVATAPRPAHIAAGIASGLFNGREVSSTTVGMPNLLVKGVFAREYVTIQENHNSDGDVTSVVQVQQPKLETTVLDLETKRYSRLAPAGSPKMDGVEGMGIEGLLEHYGESLMGVMARQCPVSYDPKRDSKDLPLVDVARPLYRAHEHAAKALYQLLGGPGLSRRERRGKAAILLGEIGSGKTATVLALGNTIAKRILVICPPHLLDSWANEVRIVLPEADVRILEDLAAVDALGDVPDDRTLIAVLSREQAKLGHGVAGVECLGCPKCGASLPSGDLAKKRIRCAATPLTLVDDLARAAFGIALHVAPQAPQDGNVIALLEGRHLGRHLDALTKAPKKRRAQWAGFDAHWVLRTIASVTQQLTNVYDERLARLLGDLLMADYQPERIAALARTFSGEKLDYRLRELARALTCLLPFGSKLQDSVQELTYGQRAASYYSASFETDAQSLKGQGLTHSAVGSIKLQDGQLVVNDSAPESLKLALSILGHLAKVGRFTRAEEECGEPLFQAVPEPRRYPIAKYIAKRHPTLFDFLVLDEGQDFANGDTAQAHAAHRLTTLGIPFVLMTGSLMNGYADSLFINMWSVSPSFRADFKRDEIQRFSECYGYSKRVVTDKDRDTKEVIAFGTQSDRVERASRTAGKAPGILPLFLFRYLLGIAVTLHKADLALDLPKCTHIKCEIEPSPQLLKNYKALVSALKAQISKDRFVEGMAGKLFGALAELPSYLDRATADTGNQDDGTYGIYYPESVGGKLVATVAPLPAKKLLPKEQWLIDTVRAELAEGRTVMVFCRHVNLLPRYARILKDAFGRDVPVLNADKVPPHKREAWINKNVRGAGADLMLANPVGIQTGLNNLVYFATEIWMEDPASNPTIFRQATGRVDRVGQDKPTRIYSPVYAGTLQVQMHELLLRKVAVATATDGLDNESMLLAAGAAEDAMLTGLSIGRMLWNMLADVN